MLRDTVGLGEPAPSRRLLYALTVAGLIPVVLGFAFSLPDFIAHVLAGVAGLILGAVLAVVLIDRLLSQRRSEQWHVVRDQMLALICERIVEVGADYSSALPGKQGFFDRVGPEDDPVARPDVAIGLRELTAAVRDAAPELSKDVDYPDRASTRLLYDQVEPLLAPLQDAMTTRVIALGDDPGLVAQLLSLERAQQKWRIWIETVERAGAPDSYAWEQATLALAAACDLYEYILDIC
jgi:hypothetical protein